MIIRFALLLISLATLTGCATSSIGSGNVSVEASEAWDKQPKVLSDLTEQIHKEWSRNITMSKVKAPAGTTVQIVIQVFSDG